MEVSEAAIRVLGSLLGARTGQQLAMSRSWRIHTVLQSLVRERGLGSLDRLVHAVAAGGEPELADAVVDALLNNETSFYRDRTSFEQLLGPALARLEEARARTRRLSIWSAGCSTGQEAYSLAMWFAERKSRWAGWTIEIVASDVSRAAVEQARGGLYSQFEVQRGLPVTQMMRWFEERPGANWQISDELRAMVRFEMRSLIDAPPAPGRFDIILCRNVLLYFAEPVRRTVFSRLAEAAAEDGVLMLGAGETVIGQTRAFVSDPDCRGLYLRHPEAMAPCRAAS
ncbi:protein-glutamate O-methyltransferase CheR [Sphingomonas parva]|uniref:Protein-glutamate O-methyltransferase CheR n=1 Tax=Sphingomonas parva TaxID=2555898 RepID=A0A4Y8ZX13_9SPHN|nr:protein-glutamate O-methyltransferase CheR [Sphingomonas parva]TFI59309.1 protein-glutamate O-methyltransferase CheR [Sphingomonas parva]